MNRATYLSKLFQNSKNISAMQIVIVIIVLSSSDEFSVATPDETAGKDTEFSSSWMF